MKPIHWITVFGLIVMTAGCNQVGELTKVFKPKQTVNAQTDAPAPANPSSDDDVKLAQIILKPQRHQLSVTNDPFKPLLANADLDLLPASGNPMDAQVLNDVQFLGLIKIGDESSVLLKVFEEKGIYKLNDQIKQWTISEINPEYVLLKKDDNFLKLKRGDK